MRSPSPRRGPDFSHSWNSWRVLIDGAGSLSDWSTRWARRLGPLPYDDVIELALYHPEHGFYSRGGGAGRGTDFLTSPEVGPLFGAVVARALDAWWADLGHPDPYVVVEAGAGGGTLARDVLAADPDCSPALRYVLVERSQRLQEHQEAKLPMEPAWQLAASICSGLRQCPPKRK